MSDAIEAKLTSWGARANGEVRLSFIVHRDDAEKVDELRRMVGHDFGIAFAKIDNTGGMPVAASGEASVPDGLNHNEGTAALATRPPTTAGGCFSLDNDNTAAGARRRPPPSRLPSQGAFLLCNQPRGRVFLEQRRRHAIPAANHINNVDEAKHVLRAWLQVDSLSELDRDPIKADQWERIEADYKTWLTAARYVEAP